MIVDEARGDAEIISTVQGMLSADQESGHLVDSGVDSVAHIAVDRDDPDDAPAAGDAIGDFEIISQLGRGGMGVVYAARDRKLGRIVALKLLPSHLQLDSEARDRLIEEAQAASALDHPNVATIYQIGETADGRRFIAMARYEGETLRERLLRGKIPPRDALSIARQIAQGLAAAHSAGLVHRDVKPENVFLTKQGLAKLLDFGIATAAGSAREGKTTRGTILYMSPEHARERTANAASDVWSLGVVLYEMLEGRTPYTGTTAQEIFAQIADPAPVPLPSSIRQLPAPVAATVSRALEKNWRRRFGSADELLAQLERAERAWSRPWLLPVGIALALILSVSGAIAYTARHNGSDTAGPQALAMLPVTGDSTDRDAFALASAIGDEIAARVVGLGQMRLLHVGADSARSIPNGGHVVLLKLGLERNESVPTIAVSLERADSRETFWQTRRALDRSQLSVVSRDLVVAALNAMGKPLTERERAAIGTSFPSNPEAYENFLRGNRLLAIRTPASVELAMASFQKAARADTTFAAAFARQSYAYTVLVDWGWKPTARFPGDPLKEGLALADRATRLDSTSADAWLARAYILVQLEPRRFTGAIEAFQHAIALDPYNAEAFHQYGQSLMALGRYTEALAAYRRVLDLEPDRAMTLVPMAAIAKRLGRRQEALSYLDSAEAAYPQIPYVRATRALLLARLGNLAAARKEAEAGVAIPSGYRIPQLGVFSRILGLQGETARALSVIAEAERSIPNPGRPSPTDVFWLAIGELPLGRTDVAKRLLRSVHPAGAVAWFMFQADELSAFRKDPEVASLLSKMDPGRPAE